MPHPHGAIGVVWWLQVCPKHLALGGGYHFFPNPRGGLVPYPPPLGLPHRLSDMRATDSGLQRTMDGGVGCFTAGVIDDDPYHIKGDLYKREGGGAEHYM